MKTIHLISGNEETEFIQLQETCNNYHLCELDQFIYQEILAGSYTLMDHNRKVLCKNFTIGTNGITDGFDSIQKIQLWSFYREINGLFESDVIQIGSASDNQLNYYQFNQNNVFYFSLINDEYILTSLHVDMDKFEVQEKNVKFILKKN